LSFPAVKIEPKNYSIFFPKTRYPLINTHFIFKSHPDTYTYEHVIGKHDGLTVREMNSYFLNAASNHLPYSAQSKERTHVSIFYVSRTHRISTESCPIPKSCINNL